MTITRWLLLAASVAVFVHLGVAPWLATAWHRRQAPESGTGTTHPFGMTLWMIPNGCGVLWRFNLAPLVTTPAAGIRVPVREAHGTRQGSSRDRDCGRSRVLERI
jgi:uncharacterized membrane protein